MSEEITEERVESTRRDLMQGLEITITEMQDRLRDQVDGLSTKQLRRALLAHINYPDTPEIDDLTLREQKFLSGLILLHQNRVPYEIQILADIQKEQEQLSKGDKDDIE